MVVHAFKPNSRETEAEEGESLRVEDSWDCEESPVFENLASWRRTRLGQGGDGRRGERGNFDQDEK